MRKFNIQFNKKISLLRRRPLNIRKIFLWFGLSCIGLFLFGVLAFGILFAVMSIDLPDVHDIDKTVLKSTTIYDRKGNVLLANANGENRQYVYYDQISPQLVNATIAIEDRDFWQHPGFSVRGILRAAAQSLTNSDAEGGSTITQQYIKRAFLTPEKTYSRKMKEVILAVQLERAFDKDKILELYLNKIFYGNGAYGIEKAAETYFNKHAKDLDLAESSLLASIPNLPTYYNPYGPHLYPSITKKFTAEELAQREMQNEEGFKKNIKKNEFKAGLIGKNVEVEGLGTFYFPGRSDKVLNDMMTAGFINDDQRKTALTEVQKIKFNNYQKAFRGQHFLYYVLEELEQKYDKQMVEEGGLKVYTTLDPRLQDIAEKVVKEGADSNTKKFNAKNASLVAMDPRSGQILAMVGSKDYFDISVDGNENVATDYRQPGSSFKPFVYAQAFYNRYAPSTVIFDTPIKLGSNTPKNFNGKFSGSMTMRSALGQSRNIPAIKAYYVAGEQKTILKLAQKMGINFQELQNDPDFQYGYPLALGSAGVRLLDMVTAYSVFANGGIHYNPSAILKVENANGENLPEWTADKGTEALDPQIAFLITNVLSDTSVRLDPNLTISNQINAAKSGTSDRKLNGVDYPHDLWTMGYTTQLVTGVWAGNNNDKRDGIISTSADGTNVAGPIWKKFMTEALKGTPAQEFPVPEGIKSVGIATASGKLPGPNTPSDQIKNEIFASFAVPTDIDDSYSLVDIDTLCGKLANEFTPEGAKKKVAYIHQSDIADMFDWQKGVNEWLQKQPSVSPNDNASVISGPPPTESCPQRNEQNYSQKPAVKILSPTLNSPIATGNILEIQVEINSTRKISKVEFYLDGTFKYSTVTPPYKGEIRLPKGEETHPHTITVKAHDGLGFVGESSLEIGTKVISTQQQ